MPMSPARPAPRFPIVLIASGHDWIARSLESILLSSGMAAATVITGRDVLDRVRSSRTDAVILDSSLPDMSSLELCRTLREGPFIEAQTPIMLVASTAPARRKDRIDALRAGAWGYYDLSLDSDELLVRLNTYLKAKLASDHVRESSLEDELTGLYSLQGLLRRLREMASDAFRHRRPLACLAIDTGPRQASRPVHDSSANPASRFAEIFRRSCRASDAIARLPSNEFVVAAPETDASGAERLAERIADSVSVTTGADGSATDSVRIGLFAVSNFKDSALEPVDLLNGATAALDLSRSGGN